MFIRKLRKPYEVTVIDREKGTMITDYYYRIRKKDFKKIVEEARKNCSAFRVEKKEMVVWL